ncbi:hypothetical protein STRNTR1_1435 [Stenotrophomonas maltophilia]|nr:hypothetical protein STRNTR1_1435 [Stenotrophomonas maltophilia]
MAEDSQHASTLRAAPAHRTPRKSCLPGRLFMPQPTPGMQ